MRIGGIAAAMTAGAVIASALPAAAAIQMGVAKVASTGQPVWTAPPGPVGKSTLALDISWRATETAILDDGIKGGLRYRTLPAGLPLVKAELSLKDGGARTVWCDTRVAADRTLNCLSDEDGDGKLDAIWISNGSPFAIGFDGLGLIRIMGKVGPVGFRPQAFDPPITAHIGVELCSEGRFVGWRTRYRINEDPWTDLAPTSPLEPRACQPVADTTKQPTIRIMGFPFHFQQTPDGLTFDVGRLNSP